MGGLQRRGSYFYVIDAFIASIIVVATIIIMASRFSAQGQPTQAFYTAEDFLATAETTKIGSYDDPRIREWLFGGLIDDPNRPLLQQMALFEITNNLTGANNLSLIIGNSTPQNIGIEIIINGRRSYIRESTNQAQADTLLTARRIVLLRKSPTDTYDPVILEVRTWQ